MVLYGASLIIIIITCKCHTLDSTPQNDMLYIGLYQNCWTLQIVNVNCVHLYSESAAGNPLA